MHRFRYFAWLLDMSRSFFKLRTRIELRNRDSHSYKLAQPSLSVFELPHSERFQRLHKRFIFLEVNSGHCGLWMSGFHSLYSTRLNHASKIRSVQHLPTGTGLSYFFGSDFPSFSITQKCKTAMK